MGNLHNNRKMSTKTMVTGAILTALVVVLQLVAALVPTPLPFSISLVLLPIVIGAAICGPGVSAWLGFVFGLVVLFTNSAAFLAVNPVATIVTVLAKGIACGYAAGLVYKLIEKKNKYLAVIASAVVCPIVNTGVFLIGCFLFFFKTIEGWGLGLGYQNAIEYIFIGMIGVNFLVELATNIVLSPVVLRIINIGKKE